MTYRDDLDGIDWPALKSALAEDDFDNGRTPEQLRLSFENSWAVSIAWSGREVVGTARVLSDGVCNSYLVDMWTAKPHRRKGIATEMMNRLQSRLAGQHIYLQADEDVAGFYRRLGFREQPLGLSRVVGRWLVNDPE